METDQQNGEEVAEHLGNSGDDLLEEMEGEGSRQVPRRYKRLARRLTYKELDIKLKEETDLRMAFQESCMVTTRLLTDQRKEMTKKEVEYQKISDRNLVLEEENSSLKKRLKILTLVNEEEMSDDENDEESHEAHGLGDSSTEEEGGGSPPTLVPEEMKGMACNESDVSPNSDDDDIDSICLEDIVYDSNSKIVSAQWKIIDQLRSQNKDLLEEVKEYKGRASILKKEIRRLKNRDSSPSQKRKSRKLTSGGAEGQGPPSPSGIQEEAEDDNQQVAGSSSAWATDNGNGGEPKEST